MSRCPVNGCGATIPRSKLMCRDHWFSVSAPLRSQLLRAYRPGQESDHEPSEAYIDAMVACIQDANRKVRSAEGASS